MESNLLSNRLSRYNICGTSMTPAITVANGDNRDMPTLACIKLDFRWGSSQHPAYRMQTLSCI